MIRPFPYNGHQIVGVPRGDQQHNPDPFGCVRVDLVCEDCGGHWFGQAGPEAGREEQAFANALRAVDMFGATCPPAPHADIVIQALPIGIAGAQQ